MPFWSTSETPLSAHQHNVIIGPPEKPHYRLIIETPLSAHQRNATIGPLHVAKRRYWTTSETPLLAYQFIMTNQIEPAILLEVYLINLLSFVYLIIGQLNAV